MNELLRKYVDVSSIVSLPVFAISLAWAWATNFLDTLNNPPTLFIERAVIIASLHLLLFGVVYGVIKITSSLSKITQTVLVVIALFIFSGLRGLFLALIFTAIRGDNLSLVPFRSISSLAVIGLPILVAGIVHHQIRNYSKTRQLILDEFKRVAELTKQTQEQIRELSEVRVKAIRDMVLGSLGGSNPNSLDLAADAIQSTIEDVVRPISHELDKEIGLTVPESEPASKMKIDWGEAIKSAFLPININPTGVTIAFVLTTSTRILFFQSFWESVYLFVVVSLFPWLLLTTLKKILGRITKGISKSMTAVFFVFGVVGVGFIIGLLTLPVGIRSAQPLAMVFQSPFFIFALTALFGLAKSTSQEAAQVNRRFEATTAELAWEATRVLDEYRQLKRQLAKALHGPIQTQLMSSLIKLENSKFTGEKAIKEVTNWLTEEFEVIELAIRSGQVKKPSSLKNIFFELGSIWEGAATIELVGSLSDADALSADPRLMITLGELVPELTFNAVRHGQATSVVFSISLTDRRTLKLECKDNGTRPPEKSRVGLGTRLLDECAISWRRFTKDNHTITEIELPFANEAVLAA